MGRFIEALLTGKFLGDIVEARNMFAFMFYGTFCWLCLHHTDIPTELNNAVSFMMGYFFAKNGDKPNDIKKDPGAPSGT